MNMINCDKDLREKMGMFIKLLFLFATIVFNMMKLLQWRFQEVLDASIPVWAPKLKP